MVDQDPGRGPRYTERLEGTGAVTSVGSRGDSYDNALAESVIGLYKAELVERKGPWRGLDDLEYATLEWVDWFNHRRLFSAIGYVPPAEYEANLYRGTRPGGGRDSMNGVSIKPGAVQFGSLAPILISSPSSLATKLLSASFRLMEGNIQAAIAAAMRAATALTTLAPKIAQSATEDAAASVTGSNYAPCNHLV